MLVWSDNQIPKFSEGYGYTPDCLYEHISRSGLPIRRSKPQLPNEIGRLQMGIGIGYFSKEDVINEIVINHSIPDTFVKSQRYSVGFTFWETNQLPKNWVEKCNEMDEVWTCSKAMQDVFINSGITKPVHEFKLGVDPELYFPKKRSPHRQFTFLSIGSPATRKNSQMAVDAFLKTYGRDEDFRLIYKSNGPPDARMWFGDDKMAINHPRITVIDEEVSHAELARIYDKADCVLFPTSGEGWGNLPFQAIAKGIPTICTNILACTEFANMSVPLDFEWDSSTLFGLYVGCGQWAKPSFDDLCDKMKYVVNNYDQVADKTYKNAMWIGNNMTWQKVSEKYIDRMWKILESVK